MQIPFYANTKDNTRCVQACLRMLFSVLAPRRIATWNNLDKATDHRPGKWTWDIDALLAIKHVINDAKIIYVDSFDHKRFAKKGVKYLEDIWFVSVFREQQRHADLPRVQKKTRLLFNTKSDRFRFLHREPRLQDVLQLWSQGYFLIVTLNAMELGDRGGVAYHAVVVTGATPSGIIVHDPGLPPRPSRRINRKTFSRAMRPGSIIAVQVGRKTLNASETD
ncbi:MAG: hypothetical protein V1685_03635 [Parcubacteria group bacterium]